MRKKAVLVGIDDYPFSPLSSCVEDVRQVRDALVKFALFRGDEIIDLTAAQSQGKGLAARERILDVLRPLYDGTEYCDELLFYFSGHGISYRSGNGAGALNAVLLCEGVSKVEDDGDRMIDLDELLERFRMRGPKIQYWIVDACRDIPADKPPPVVSVITWGRKDPEGPRSRALLHAVAPLGQATATVGGLGRLTERILKALAGQGSAAYWDEFEQSYVVSLRSVCEYARARMAPLVVASWQRDFVLPRLELESDPAPPPLRVLPKTEWPPDRLVSLVIDPKDAANAVEASLSRQRQVHASWPPGPAGPLPSGIYAYTAGIAAASADWDEVTPARGIIDTREVDEIRLTVHGRGPRASNVSVVEQASDALPDVATGIGEEPITPMRYGGSPVTPSSLATLVAVFPAVALPLPIDDGKHGWFRVEATDPGAQVVATALEAGGQVQQFSANRWQQFKPGYWRLTARLGDETLGEVEHDLEKDDHVQFRIVAQLDRSLRAADWSPGTPLGGTAADSLLMPSETIGSLQAAQLPTLLPLLAYRPFDRTGHVLERLATPGLERRQPGPADAPIGVAMSFERGGADPGDISVGSPSGSIVAQRAWMHPAGLQVFAGATTEMPWRGRALDQADNLLTLRVPGYATLEIAVPLLEARVAAVGVGFGRSRGIEASLGSFALELPGPDDGPSAGAISHAAAIGARLLAAAEPLAVGLQALDFAAQGKWLDPVLGALAWHGYAAQADREANHVSVMKRTIACNMFAFFPGLADSTAILLAELDSPSNPGDPLEILPAGIRAVVYEAALAPEASGGPSELAGRLESAGWDAFVRAARSRLLLPYKGPSGTPRQAAHAVLMRQPVLGPSVDLLAKAAQARKRLNHWALERRRQLDPRAIWNIVQRVPEEQE